MSRGDLTDEEWVMLEPLLPVSGNRCGRWRSHRQVINGIIHRLSTGAQWRERPQRFGPWQTVHKRHLPWSADGTWDRLVQHVQAVADATGGIDWDINIDSTSVRAHQHAAGAPKHSSLVSSNPSKNGEARGEPGTVASGEPARSVGESGAAGEAHGRSRGGLTTKLHLSGDGKCRPLSLLITSGQRADCTQFESVMDKIRVPRLGQGRPRRTPANVGADKAYSNRQIRFYLRQRGIRHVIPEQKGHKAAWLPRGGRGGRPPGFDRDRYKYRHTVERAIGKLKQFRAVATRYDKRGYVYLGTATAGTLFIWLRS
ncbi:IS5 family transposase [Streptomyces avermitilis]|uniref:IS5 family transposase n=1 Tax=Streptomyces avermitilis TaxID=33903 RepID=UPI00340A712C